LLAAMGVIMIVGGLLVFWNTAIGGLVVLVPAVVGLVYTYQHQWTRIPLLKTWAAAVILAWLCGILAGYALTREVQPYDEAPVNGQPLAPPEPPVA
jgi:4-hydroxybenzoate polyprenyltransferase